MKAIEIEYEVEVVCEEVDEGVVEELKEYLGKILMDIKKEIT